MLCARHEPALRKDQHLARLHVADHFTADRMNRAAFGRDNVYAVRRLPEAQRPEAVRITRTDQLLRAHQHKGIRAVERVHRAAQRVLNGRRAQSFARDDIRDCFRVARRVKDRAGQLQCRAQSSGVGKIAVVRERHPALLVVDLDRLTVCAVRAARRAVARVRNCHRRFRKRSERLFRKHFGHQSDVLMRYKHTIVVYDNAAAFLPAMLQGIQTVVAQMRTVCRAVGKHAEYAAFLMYCHGLLHCLTPVYSTSCSASKPSSPVRTLTTFSTS